MNEFTARRPTIIDVATRAGVSPQTVSNVIYRLKKPRPETLRRVSEAIEQLGYHPNPAAKALRSQRTETIALLLEDPDGLGIHDPLHGEFLQGVCRAARKAGQTVIVDFLQPKETADHARRLIRDRKAGSLILSLGRLTRGRRKLLEGLVAAGVPIVLLQQPVCIPGITTIKARDREGAAKAVQHLYEKNHRSILFLTAQPEWPAPIERKLGIRKACVDLNIELVEHACAAYTVTAAREAIAQIVAEKHNFSAVIAVNDVVALGVIAQLEHMGKKIPLDYAVVGFNDFNFSSWVRPSISTVIVPGQIMGERAAEIIVGTGNGEKTGGEVVFSTAFVARESSQSLHTSVIPESDRMDNVSKAHS